MKRKIFLTLVLTLFLIGLIKCESGEDVEATPPEDDDLIQPSEGKFDTGYWSNLATELEGEFSGNLRLDLSGLSDYEKNNLKFAFENNKWDAHNIILDQIKFGKIELNTDLLHMNLYSDTFNIDSVTYEGDIMIVHYVALLESIVTREELEKKGVSLDSILNNPKTVRLPADPRRVFQRIGDRCATGFDAGELNDYNYFYYFDANKSGCDLEILEATFTVTSLAPPDDTTYPEYDKLIEDGQITVAVFFGAAEHEEQVSSSDSGVIEWKQFVSDIKNRGFKKVSDLEPGERYSRVRSGIEEIIDIVSPYDLHALNNDTNGIFRRAVQEHEVILYLGHSFYGSLNVLEDASAYPPDTYQIFFMNSCWSYEYYTTQIFKNKATEDDPNGWRYADVINNTEIGWFHDNAEEARIVLTNLFAGAETGGKDSQNRYYTWANIITAMNKWALDNFNRYNLDKHQIYGVSGVRDNRYDPEATENPEEGKRYENNTGMDIPDYNMDGIRSEINVTDSITPAQIRVSVNISHPYIGDLVVSLVRGDVEVVLHDKDGGMSQNLVREYQITDEQLLGKSGQGSWYLKVVDAARTDAGRLNNWAITLIPSGGNNNQNKFDNNTAMDIPDNDSNGIRSEINVPTSVNPSKIKVAVNITHPYIGDLVVSLVRNDVEIVLHNREGMGSDDILREFEITDSRLIGKNAQGSWYLKVVDKARQDSGRINSWSLIF